jgi:hypothetical protein
MGRCWAKSLGDCSGPISGEHYISSGLFEQSELFVHGFNWCKNEIKQIPKKSLVANILCHGHNTRLSDVDNAGIQTFRVFQECTELSNLRNTMKPRYWNIIHRNVDGPMLERWFLKTLINFACEGEQKIGPDSEIVGQPSDNLVRIVYGLDKFEGRAGLYLLASAGQHCQLEDRIEYIPMAHSECLPGGLFLFRGFFFVLYLAKAGIEPNAELEIPAPLPYGAMATGGLKVTPMFHNEAMKFAVQRKMSHVIKFKW